MPAGKTGSAKKEILVLKISLLDVQPEVWREVHVPADMTLARLHHVIQAAMGWTNSHLHEFEAGRESFGPPASEWEDQPQHVQDERKVIVADIAPRSGRSFAYLYDFGDDWDHEVRVLSRELAKAKTRYPLCAAGARACPPEDCGGPFGYQEMLDALRDPRHERRAEFVEWIGEDFDSEKFDLASTRKAVQNAELALTDPRREQRNRTTGPR